MSLRFLGLLGLPESIFAAAAWMRQNEIWCSASLVKVEASVAALKMLFGDTSGENGEAGIFGFESGKLFGILQARIEKLIGRELLNQGFNVGYPHIHWRHSYSRGGAGWKICPPVGSLMFWSMSRHWVIFIGQNNDNFAFFSFPGY